MAAYYQLLKREELEGGKQVAYYRPSKHAQGAWNEKEQHMGPATGVICAELERFQIREDMRFGRISLDIYGMIYLTDFKITTQCIRPGRTIELIESKFEANGRICIVARAWRMLTEDTRPVKGIEDASMPKAADLPYWNGMSIWGGGYIQSISQHIKKGKHRPGKGQVWISSPLAMVEGQTPSAFVKLMGLVDTMNGVVVRREEFDYMFPNLDLQLHLYRMPEGTWLGMDVQQQFGVDGIGLTSAVLHDEKGSFGHAEQILTLRKMPNPKS